jgi:hypothetical protein
LPVAGIGQSSGAKAAGKLLLDFSVLNARDAAVIHRFDTRADFLVPCFFDFFAFRWLISIEKETHEGQALAAREFDDFQGNFFDGGDHTLMLGLEVDESQAPYAGQEFAI